MNEKNKEKKPLVTLDAANPAPDGVVKTEPVVGGWAGGADTKPQGNGQEPLSDGSQTINEHQLRALETAPDGVATDEILNAGGHDGKLRLNDSALKNGLWQGSPEALGYDIMIERMNLTRPVETDEERRARLKKQRRNSLFAAIGDGISALSNLYFTTQGSPSADQSKTMSKALTDRYDKEDKEREAEEKSRLSTLLSVLNQKRLARSSWLARKNQAELIELKKKAAEAGNKAAMRRVDELMRHNTELERQAREEAEKENKRKAENDKRDQERKDKLANSRIGKEAAQRSATLQNASSNAKRAAADVANKQDQIRKRRYGGSGGRGGNGGYNTTETVSWYDDQGRKHSKTTRGNSGGGAQKKKLRKNNMGL